MKRLGLWLSLLMASLAAASAQVTVEVTQEQEQFLPGEAVPAAVRITNRSGQPLHLGAEDDWLTFTIDSHEGRVVPKIDEVPVTGEFVLESSKVATKRVDLAPYFSLTEPGRYDIIATVRIKGWDREITSPPKGFNVIQGAKLWEQDVGVPATAGATNAVPEVRKFILQQANYLKGQLRLYVRLTDAYGAKPLRVARVGPMVSFSHPEPQVDKASNLHLLYQSGPFAFSYNVFNIDGELITRQTYDFINTRPRLRADEDGNISVTGGVRRIAANDVPAPKLAEPPDEALRPPDPPPTDKKVKPAKPRSGIIP